MPDIDIPEITVQVDADDMSARELEDAVVSRMRRELMQVNYLEDLRSETSNGNAVIKLDLAYGTDIDYSFVEVNEKIDRAMAYLPRDIKRPRVIKASASDVPVFYLNLTLRGTKATGKNGRVNQKFIDFNRFVKQVVRNRIEQLPEVAMVDVNGLVSTEILIEPHTQKMIALGVSLREIESAIIQQDVEIGSILVKNNQYQYNLRLGSSLKTIEDLQNIYIKTGNRLFQLKELAEVHEQPAKRTGLVLFNGREAVTMAVIKQEDQRMGALKRSLNHLVAQMKEDYPEVTFTIVRDQTKLLDYAIGNLIQSLLWGISLAFLVMFLFLRDLRSPVLIGISVPISLVVSLLFFHLLDISINIISLSGLILGSGLMIDNAIIVIDNITQYNEKGYSLSEACIQGTNEVTKPMLSSVLTTCAVFIPLVFLSGVAGAIFYDQAMAITIGLFVSLFVSVSLLPLLYRLMYLKRKKNAFSLGLKKPDTPAYLRFYKKGFRIAMRKQSHMSLIFIALIMLSILIYFTLPKRQMPKLTTAETMLTIDWNEPINLEENKRRILQLANKIDPWRENYNAQVGQHQFLLERNTEAKSSEASVYIEAESPQDLNHIKREVKPYLQQLYPDAVVTYEEVDNLFNLIFTGSEAPLTARLRGMGVTDNDRYDGLEQVWKRLQAGLPGIILTPIVWEEQIGLRADIEKMKLYDISTSELNTALEKAFNEREVLSITGNQEFIPVVIGSEEKAVNEVLQETLLRTSDSTFIHVGHFLTRTQLRGLQTITAGKAGEYYPIDLGIAEAQEEEIIHKVKEIVKEADSYDVSFTGSLFQGRELVRELIIVFSITVALLYFILASQFESLTVPLIILAEIPLSIAGSLLLLQLSGMSLNLMSMIGIVVMSGIIINDSILKIDTIIQLQKRGYSLLRALLVAGQRRLKPILMTSITTILALLPILLTGGLGGELQAPLAVALIGGMLVGTIVSLYFIPLFYYQLARKKRYPHE